MLYRNVEVHLTNHSSEWKTAEIENQDIADNTCKNDCKNQLRSSGLKEVAIFLVNGICPAF